MVAYTRRQLVLLSVVVTVGAGGLAVDRWRRANTEVVAYLETLDRAAPPPRAAIVHRPSAGASGPLATARASSAPAAARHETMRRRRAPAADTTPVDVNLASAADFERLPGVGRALAARIVDVRAREGPFASVDDLRRVRGVGDAMLERLRPRLAVNTP